MYSVCMYVLSMYVCMYSVCALYVCNQYGMRMGMTMGWDGIEIGIGCELDGMRWDDSKSHVEYRFFFTYLMATSV